MSSSKQNLLSSMSVVLRMQDFSVTDSISPCGGEKKKKKDLSCTECPLLELMSIRKVKGHEERGCGHHKNEVALMSNRSVPFMTTHIFPARSVVKGHHVQDLLLFDKCAVAFDPT